MKKKVLALLDSNKGYMEKLYRYLEEQRNIGFTICAFTGEDKLYEYLNRERIDYLIASEDLQGKVTGVERVIWIYEDEEKDGIYRYSPGDAVVERLRDLIGFEEVKTGASAKTKFIGVYSPVGRCMKTSFSMVLGQMLSKKNRVLYLNFESFSGMSVMDSASRRTNLADVLYYFNNIRNEFSVKFKNSLVNYNGLDMVTPAYYYLDLSYITAEIWDRFLEEISGMNEYDYVILDLSDYLQGLFDSFLTRCSIVYTLTSNDSRAQNKIFHYEQILSEYNYEDILNKTRKFTIPSLRNLPNEIDRLLYTELVDLVRKETAADFEW